MRRAAADWTNGEEAILYQACASCGHAQYFRRDFCAACGSNDVADKRASGEGTVYASSLVCRAATPEARAHVPYNILLVDAVEGFRMMAHGAQNLAIGDTVRARFTRFAGRLVPYFERGTRAPFRADANAQNVDSDDCGFSLADRPGLTNLRDHQCE